jgi:hypothetical protein
MESTKIALPLINKSFALTTSLINTATSSSLEKKEYLSIAQKNLQEKLGIPNKSIFTLSMDQSLTKPVLTFTPEQYSELSSEDVLVDSSSDLIYFEPVKTKVIGISNPIFFVKIGDKNKYWDYNDIHEKLFLKNIFDYKKEAINNICKQDLYLLLDGNLSSNIGSNALYTFNYILDSVNITGKNIIEESIKLFNNTKLLEICELIYKTKFKNIEFFSISEIQIDKLILQTKYTDPATFSMSEKKYIVDYEELLFKDILTKCEDINSYFKIS